MVPSMDAMTGNQKISDELKSFQYTLPASGSLIHLSSPDQKFEYWTFAVVQSFRTYLPPSSIKNHQYTSKRSQGHLYGHNINNNLVLARRTSPYFCPISTPAAFSEETKIWQGIGNRSYFPRACVSCKHQKYSSAWLQWETLWVQFRSWPPNISALLLSVFHSLLQIFSEETFAKFDYPSRQIE